MTQWIRVETIFAVTLALGIAAWQLRERWDTPAAEVLVEVPESPSSTPIPADPPATHEVAADPQPRRISGKLLLVSTTSEGQLAVAIAAFAEPNDQLWVAAWSANAGRLMWRWPLPAGANSDNTERALLDDSILVRTAEDVARLDAETGRVIWTARAPEPSGRLCATQAFVAVKTDKPPTQALYRETGAPLAIKPGPCEALYSSEDAGPNFSYLEAASSDWRRRPKDFTVIRELLPKQGNARVVLGTKGADATPAVAVVADGRGVWQQDVSAYTAAQLPAPALAAVRRESVVVPFWDVQNRALRLAGFSLANGARLWEVALSERTTVRPDIAIDVAVTLDGVVLTLIDGGLRAYSLSTGDLQWSSSGT